MKKYYVADKITRILSRNLWLISITNCQSLIFELRFFVFKIYRKLFDLILFKKLHEFRDFFFKLSTWWWPSGSGNGATVLCRCRGHVTLPLSLTEAYNIGLLWFYECVPPLLCYQRMQALFLSLWTWAVVVSALLRRQVQDQADLRG